MALRGLLCIFRSINQSNMKRPYKVRFNLGVGKNYMKWKIESPEGIEYYLPDGVQIVMHGCQLKNQRKTAEKINGGANKTVCAWVRCESLEIYHPGAFQVEEGVDVQLKYNPRVLPHWFVGEGSNADNAIIGKVVTFGRKLYHKH